MMGQHTYTDMPHIRGAKTQQPARSESYIEKINGSTTDEDVIGCLEVIFNTEHGELLRTEALRWLQGIVRANKQARDLLMVSSFVEKVLDLLHADAVVCAPSIKVTCRWLRVWLRGTGDRMHVCPAAQKHTQIEGMHNSSVVHLSAPAQPMYKCSLTIWSIAPKTFMNVLM
jgi:hypothetical protein